MSSSSITILGTGLLALLLAGYLAQRLMPPPKPRIVGIDLGTTFSCVGVYLAGTGEAVVLKDEEGQSCIPSVVAFTETGVLTGRAAVAQAESRPLSTIYDAKRFIGKKLSEEELAEAQKRYPFQIQLDSTGKALFPVGPPQNQTIVTPERVASYLLSTLRQTAERHLVAPVRMAVISVPAEFGEMERNATVEAARLAGLEVLRVISEPTAAAMAYGLHGRPGVSTALVVDLGGGTLDVSLLRVQGGMFLTQAMAGNNHLGGQDFTQRLFKHLLAVAGRLHGFHPNHSSDLQLLRQAADRAKLRLTLHPEARLQLRLHSPGRAPVTFRHTVFREDFEALNADLFVKVLQPIEAVLSEAGMGRDQVEEVVLVGGATRVPKVREIIKDFFQKEPNVSVDPELAVAHGVAVQAGILGGMWPLTVSAIELPSSARKIHVY